MGAIVVAACADPDPRATGTKRVEVKVCPNAVVEGIDVSVYQGTIDWAAVKGAGIDYAIIRTSDGLDFPDSKFATNWAGAKQAGVIRGVYQFFEPAQDPIAQADMMLDAMGPLAPGDLPPTIDVETTGGKAPAEVAAAVRAWTDHVAEKIGRAPMIYVGKYFWQDQVGGADQSGNPLWVAQWGVTCPDIPGPWTTWTFWQYSATGRVAGISGDVDRDRFDGDLAALVDFAGQHATCGDGTCATAAGESTDTCPADCKPCGVIDASGGVIDDGDACFVGGGDAQYLRTATDAGWQNDLTWTHATSDAAEANYATWELYFAEAGDYRVEVYTASKYAQSKLATYVVTHGGRVDNALVDQTAADGWQVIGEYDFAAGGKQSIHLGDNTGEPLAGNVQLVFDAVRVTRIDAPGGGGGSNGGGSNGGGLLGGCSACNGRASLIGIAFALPLIMRRRARPARRA
ncbi:MAG TPA: GH25 family lysozyme [Kofleriaceae bacterium]|nr:GH25 family lysozyme [Kofleriaceae bacterium]